MAVVPDETYDWSRARAVHERLAQRADDGYPDSWQPEAEGDELFGVVVAVHPNAPTRSFGPAPVVELETPTGRRSVWLFHKVLRLAFVRQNVVIGETVLIRYLGKTTPEGGGNTYDNYALVVDRPESSGNVDWNTIAARYGEADPMLIPPLAPPVSPYGEDEDDLPF